MSIWEKFKNAVGFSKKVDLHFPVRSISENRNGLDDPAREGYRLFSQTKNTVATGRDFSPERQVKMQRIGKKIHDSTALGQRVVDIRKNLLTSEGFEFEAKGESVRKNKILTEYFNKFWKDNKFNLKIDDYIKDLLIYGEICFYVPSVNPYNGRMKLMWIAPENIESITADPLNLTEADEINLTSEIEITQKIDGEEYLVKTKTLKVIRENRDGELEGNAFYFALNKTVGGMRGVCDFIHVADWIDVHRQIVNSESDRVEFSKAFVFKCQVQGGEGAVESVIKRHAKPPSGGSVLVYSDKEDWSVMQPQLTLFDTKSYSEHLVELILGGMGIPMAWFFDNSGSNNSSTSDMTKPIFTWAFKSKQRICYFFEEVFNYAIQESRKDFGPLASFSDDDCKFEIISRNPDRGAYDEIGNMLTAVATPLNTAVSSGWIDNETAGKSFRKTMRTLNLGEVPEPDEEMKNWNLEVVKAQANQQFYENIQKDEGKSKLIARLFNVDLKDKLGDDKPMQITQTIQNFLKRAIDEEIDKAKKDIAQEDANARATEDVKRQQADLAKQKQEQALKDLNKNGKPGSNNFGRNSKEPKAGDGSASVPNKM